MRGVVETGASRGMIVLLVKQVHLQKEVGAGFFSFCGRSQGVEGDVQYAEVRVMKKRQGIRTIRNRDLPFMV